MDEKPLFFAQGMQPRKVVPGLPRPSTFKRQNSERRERLLPPNPVKAEREADRCDIQRHQDYARKGGKVSVDQSLCFQSGKDDTPEQERQTLKQKWVLQVPSQHNDPSAGENIYVTYAENCTKPRRIVISYDARNAPSGSLLDDLQGLQSQAEKSALIYESIRCSLSDVRFADTVTHLQLECAHGTRLHIHVTEANAEAWDPVLLPNDLEDNRAGYKSYPENSDALRVLLFISIDKNHVRNPKRRLTQHVQEDQEIYLKLSRQLRQDPGLRKLLLEWEETQEIYEEYNLWGKRQEIEEQYKRLEEKQEIEKQKKLEQEYFIRQRIAALERQKKLSQAFKYKTGLPGSVNGHRTSALADTGAKTNVVSKAFARRIKTPISPSSSTSFRLGNSRIVKSIGTVSLSWAFLGESSNTLPIVCEVLEECTYDLILGRSFLAATETMTKFSRRLKKCAFHMTKFFHFGFMGDDSQRLHGTLGSNLSASALLDSGAERNILDYDFAIQNGLDISTDPGNRVFLQFADGSLQETVGQVTTEWAFENGDRVPVVFEVLQNSAFEVVLGDQIIYEHRVFQEHFDSFVSFESYNSIADLAPFDFVQRSLFQRLSKRLKQPPPDVQDPNETAETARTRERERRDQWNYDYDFGKEANEGEKALEASRRRDFDVKYPLSSVAPSTLSIATHSNA